MVQGYYTLEEAARILKMSSEELTQMAQKRQIRAFADRGTWRFRSQDVEEMARRRGQSSDEVQSLAAGGDAAKPKTEKHEDVFNFNISPDTADNLDLGSVAAAPAAAKPGSDSDVKLVMDSDSSEFDITGEGGIAVKPGKDKPADKPKEAKKTQIPQSPSDSEVQLVPLDEPDALDLGDQTTLTASDSDVRLEGDTKKGGKRAEDMPVTEEIKIDLDAELKKSDAARPKTGSKSSPPAASPFELSESDIQLPPEVAAKKKTLEDSSDPDFDLSPSGSMDEISLSEIVIENDDDGKKGKAGGKKPAKPADSGLKMKDSDAGSPSSSDEIEFELSLDSDGGLEDDKAATVQEEEVSSSSEFELTLDDSGGLAPLEDKPSESGETDIFETDLEVPALDEESGSEVVPLDESDTDLESSDFDFDPESSESGSQVVAIDDEADDAAKTVARKAPAKGKGRGRAAEPVAEIDDILTDEGGEAAGIAELEEDELSAEPVGARVVAAPAAPADWGPVPAIGMLLSVSVMTVLVIIAFELLHDMWGYKQSYKPSGVLIRPISGMFADLPPDQ